jgi:ATP-dependent DNA helicase DinG
LRAADLDDGLLTEARAGYEAFFHAAERQRPGFTGGGHRDANGHLPTRWALTGEIEAGLSFWGTLVQLQRQLARASQLEEGEREAIAMQAEELAATVRALAQPEPDTHIRLCERDEESPAAAPDAIHALFLPLEATDPLRRQLFDAWPSVICTSATLSVNNDLGWFGRQVGLCATDDSHSTPASHGVIARTLPGPFNYAKQMVLYTPRTLMPVYDEDRRAFAGAYVDALTAEVTRLLETSRGRALVLCTSRSRMMQLYDTLAPRLNPRFPCYLQGTLAQPDLVARFKKDGNAILFATRGFWEGLDIPGEALALVILDKIPFVPYDDPVIRRQEERVRARGGNAFYELQLGTAILSLRQGAGRLIRSETDRGVIALLDARVLQKRYGQQIIRSLPEGCHTTDFADVAAFLNRR